MKNKTANNKSVFSGFLAAFVAVLLSVPAAHAGTVQTQAAEKNSGFGAQVFVNKAPAALGDETQAADTATPKAIVTILPDVNADDLSAIAPAAGDAAQDNVTK